jgi:aldose 1-epimerase
VDGQFALGRHRRTREIWRRMTARQSVISPIGHKERHMSDASEISRPSDVTQEVFGHLPDGREVRIFTLTNRHGLRARVSEFGAVLVSMEAPDRFGKNADITLGYDTLAGWMDNPAYLGATCGRFGNRIAGGKFTLDGKEYVLATNNDPGGIPCHLHGGLIGFNKVLWSGRITDEGVEFSYLSRDGEEGYPGNLAVRVTYSLTDADELVWQVEATTDAPTIINIIHHSYWNLSGDPSTAADDHLLTINAASWLPTDAGMIPIGETAPVAGTPMDFTKPTVIRGRSEENFEALRIGNGYDHCWVVNGGGVRLAARLKDSKSGRVMEVQTDQPGVQFYAGNFLDGTVFGKNGVRYPRRGGVCLETQRFPDSPNKPAFPSCVLRPGETYRHVMIHKFSAE